MPQKNKPKVAVIGLDMDENKKEVKDFHKLSGDEQIDLVFSHLEKLALNLKKSHVPYDYWIITWPEYGITDQGKRFLNNRLRKKIKSRMAALTKQYPKLTLLAPFSTKKSYPMVDDARKESLSHRLTRIKKSADYKKNTIGLGQYDKDILTKVTQPIKNFKDSGCEVVRNTCYKCTQGKFESHEKFSPYEDELYEYENRFNLPSNRIFEWRNRKKNPVTFTIPHEKKTSAIEVGVDICLEHQQKVLKKLCKLENKNPPQINFLLSNWTPANAFNVYGEFFIQFDTREAPCLIQCTQNPSIEVEAFRSHFLSADKINLTPIPRGTMLHLLGDNTSRNLKSKMEKLIARGMDVNAIKSDDQNTPLHIAAARGNDVAISTLVDHGANLNQLNSAGETPLDVANLNWRVDSINALEKYGAKKAIELVNAGRPIVNATKLPSHTLKRHYHFFKDRISHHKGVHHLVEKVKRRFG